MFKSCFNIFQLYNEEGEGGGGEGYVAPYLIPSFSWQKKIIACDLKTFCKYEYSKYVSLYDIFWTDRAARDCLNAFSQQGDEKFLNIS